MSRAQIQNFLEQQPVAFWRETMGEIIEETGIDPPEFEDPGDFLAALQNGAVNDVVDLENEAAFFVEQTNINIPDDKLESVGAKIRKATVKHDEFLNFVESQWEDWFGVGEVDEDEEDEDHEDHDTTSSTQDGGYYYYSYH